MVQDVFIDVGPNYELNRHDLPKTCLQYGKQRHYLLTRNNNSKTTGEFRLWLGFDADSMVEIKLVEENADSETSKNIYQLQLAKYKMLNFLFLSNLPNVNIDEYILSEYILNVPEFWHELKQDASENDPNFEQIRLSLIHWHTWGAHYVR